MIDTESGQQITGVGGVGSYSPVFDSVILSPMTNWENDLDGANKNSLF